MSAKVEQKPDPTRPITSWRSAWRSIRDKAARDEKGKVIYPNLVRVRFHDLRHTAYTTSAERGVPTEVIKAQFGHSKIMEDYLHIRRRALDDAAAALQPAFLEPQSPPETAEFVN